MNDRNLLIQELGVVCTDVFRRCSGTKCEKVEDDFEKLDMTELPGYKGSQAQGFYREDSFLGETFRLKNVKDICEPRAAYRSYDTSISPSCAQGEVQVNDWNDEKERERCAKFKAKSFVKAM